MQLLEFEPLALSERPPETLDPTAEPAVPLPQGDGDPGQSDLPEREVPEPETDGSAVAILDKADPLNAELDELEQATRVRSALPSLYQTLAREAHRAGTTGHGLSNDRRLLVACAEALAELGDFTL